MWAGSADQFEQLGWGYQPAAELEINAGGEGSWEVRVVDGLMGLAELSDVCAHPSTCCFDEHRYVD